MKQLAIKTIKGGVTAPTGYTVFEVKTVLVDDNDNTKEIGEPFPVHYEVCDDTDGQPIASASTAKAAVDKAKAILDFLQSLKDPRKELKEEFERKPGALKLKASPNIVKKSRFPKNT